MGQEDHLRQANRPSPRSRLRAVRALTVTVAYTRSRGWIAATVVGGNGLHTQGKTLAEARRNVESIVRDAATDSPRQLPSGPRRGAIRAWRIEDVTAVFE